MKCDFYISQEDLIKFKENGTNLTLSDFVKQLNEKFCQTDMKKLRVEVIVDYLKNNRFLEVVDDAIVPTKKGSMLGITREERVSDSGISYEVNVYSNRMLNYILDHIYRIIN